MFYIQFAMYNEKDSYIDRSILSIEAGNGQIRL